MVTRQSPTLVEWERKNKVIVYAVSSALYLVTNKVYRLLSISSLAPAEAADAGALELKSEKRDTLKSHVLLEARRARLTSELQVSGTRSRCCCCVSSSSSSSSIETLPSPEFLLKVFLRSISSFVSRRAFYFGKLSLCLSILVGSRARCRQRRRIGVFVVSRGAFCTLFLRLSRLLARQPCFCSSCISLPFEPPSLLQALSAFVSFSREMPSVWHTFFACVSLGSTTPNFMQALYACTLVLLCATELFAGCFCAFFFYL